MTKAKLACPFCGELTSEVVDGRPRPNRRVYRRRRQCMACGKRFWTVEAVEPKKPHNML